MFEKSSGNHSPRMLIPAALALVAAAACLASHAGRESCLWHDGWEVASDDSKSKWMTANDVGKHLAWKPVTLPHDFAIHGDWLADGGGDKLPWRDRVGWYRRTFDLKSVDPAKSVFLDFDGVMAHATVYLNGQVVGGGDYGYLGFRCDLTPYLTAGRNVILVKADTRTMRSRWYPGAGIERRVRWSSVDKVRLAHESVFVTTPSVSAEKATVRVVGEVENALYADVTADVSVRLFDPRGKKVAEKAIPRVAAAALKCGAFATELEVAKPVLWELVDPAPLYTVEVAVVSGDGKVRCEDVERVRVGIRAFEFKVDDGFHLNGRRVQLNGVDLHTDMGILGMSFNRSVMRRQLKRMREMGANALRTSHNAQAPELLELCDEMGFFVWNECFDKWDGTCGRGDQNLEAFVERHLKAWTRRDRNHPSVFAWSIGNEIHSRANDPQRFANGTTYERCARFRAAVREFDTTRLVGIGSCFSGDVVASGDYDCLDITGWNYGRQYQTYLRHQPTKPVLYTESASAVSCYGFYADSLPTNKAHYAVKERGVDSMDHNSAPWSDVPDKEFERMETDRYVGGEFVWTGIDYLGEPFPYMHYYTPEIMKLPNRELARSAYFGICDLLAFPKDRFYLYRSHWNRDAFTLHVAPHHWNFKPGANRPVYVYTSAETAELFLNGRSLGRRTKDRTINTLDRGKTTTDGWSGQNGGKDRNDYYRILDRYRLRWLDVPYEPGELKAVAYGADGRALGEQVVRTAGEPVAVKLTPEADALPADGETYVFVRVNLVDAQGTEVPNRSDFIRFSLSGPGEILAVGNADPRQCERRFDQVDGHRLYYGQAGLVLRRLPGQTGVVVLRAEADGVKAATASWEK